ncbi:conjugal transfer protein [Streptococcus oriscaviae]|uniref:Conjugal transfer protein n=1 Tax=Streptococcus oriscaviae TaxID=2781599 RepID=A0ABX7YJ61_9STRE|nr:conjugal transfer protein [Streptococcus oriscaviae]QUE53553.1 conjugal transfer protein [Streptococcus oriscaviae]
MIKKIKSKEKKEILPKRFNQKNYNRIFLAGLVVFVLLSFLVIVSNLIRNTRPTEPVRQVLSEKTAENRRLENYLNNFVYYYFNFSEDTAIQTTQIEKLDSFYADSVVSKNQGYTRQPSVLNTYRLLELTDTHATYLVSYTVTSTTREGTEDVVRRLDNAVEFNVPYIVVGDKYYISDLPYFQSVRSNQLEELADDKKMVLEADNVLNSDKYSDLKDFLNLFFVNYVSSQDNLNLIAKDVTVLTATKFKTLDWAYVDESSDTMRVYAQATFETVGNTRSENFSFEIVQKDDGYFIEKLSHGIPFGYNEKEEK